MSVSRETKLNAIGAAATAYGEYMGEHTIVNLTAIERACDAFNGAMKEQETKQPVQTGWPLPCPFCSGDCAYEYYPGEGDHTISCLKCRARMGRLASRNGLLTMIIN